jgi:hypothetical protein
MVLWVYQLIQFGRGQDVGEVVTVPHNVKGIG